MDDDSDVREILGRLLQLLESSGYFILYSPQGKNEPEIWDFLTSNTLWGGAGSIADQALLQEPEARKKLESILIELGSAQIALGRVNVRTELWTSVFERLRTCDK